MKLLLEIPDEVVKAVCCENGYDALPDSEDDPKPSLADYCQAKIMEFPKNCYESHQRKIEIQKARSKPIDDAPITCEIVE